MLTYYTYAAILLQNILKQHFIAEIKLCEKSLAMKKSGNITLNIINLMYLFINFVAVIVVICVMIDTV